MKYIASIPLLLLLFEPLQAQDFSSILQSIEANSTRLEAARMETDAQKAEHRMLSTLENPEAGINYLFGKNDIGTRLDLNISQSIDMPNVMVRKRKLVRELQRVCDLQYLTQRQQIILAARKICIEVVFCNAMMEHLNEDLEETRAMKQAYQILFDKGEATIIEHNKAHQSLLFFEAEYRQFLAMKENLLEELECLNGGQPVSIADTAFVHTPLPLDFDTWLEQHLEQHPEMQLCHGELEASQESLRLERNRWAPSLRVGYMAELAREDKYQGPSIGLSLPLWNTSRQVKAARMHLTAAQTAVTDTRLHLTIQLKGIYRDALQLQETYQHYRKHLTGCDNSLLLRKSLENGQITLIDYLNELQNVHEMHERLLETERDLELRRAEMMF